MQLLRIKQRTSGFRARLPGTQTTVANWPRYPAIFEINTWVWLSELSAKYGTHTDLGSVNPKEWDAIARLGFDAVWFMGVWDRSPAGRAIANANFNLLDEFRRTLPDFRFDDNVGSPYCVRQYVVDEHLGGPDGLAAARDQLAIRGLRLLLDFVPNHVAPDHPWVTTHPEYFILGNADDIANDPASYLTVNGTIFACGRDPYSPAWPDVLQLNPFNKGLRKAATETISNIATQCDGIRCDMAMLLVNSVVERTWAERAGERPETEYWADVIPAVKKTCREFLFVAEVYWDMEWQLQQQGFDFCYDKRLYDRLEYGDAESVELHLSADLSYLGKLLRFIENHDEARAAAAFPGARERAAAVIVATLPGARLFHEGQFEGRRIRVPVFLGRRPRETPDDDLLVFYTSLLEAVHNPLFRDGDWTVCPCSGWPDNPTFRNLMAWSWKNSELRSLIVVNFSDYWSQARVRVNWDGIRGKSFRSIDRLSGAVYERNGDDILNNGLYVELGPWMYHFLEIAP